ncbi:hypothetical protein EPN18_09805 [bacterium]|nr:MAG: hypothetical protein EPN18_09805 [bacterium]
MKSFFLTLAVMLVFAGSALAVDPSSVQRISPEELKAKMVRGEDVIIIDARSPGSYNGSSSRIKGDIRIPFSDINAMVDKLPNDKEVAVYCT